MYGFVPPGRVCASEDAQKQLDKVIRSIEPQMKALREDLRVKVAKGPRRGRARRHGARLGTFSALLRLYRDACRLYGLRAHWARLNGDLLPTVTSPAEIRAQLRIFDALDELAGGISAPTAEVIRLDKAVDAAQEKFQDLYVRNYNKTEFSRK